MYNSEEIQDQKELLKQAVLNGQPFKPLYVKLKVFYGRNLKCEMCNHWRERREPPILNELARKARALVPGLEVSVIPNGIDRRNFWPLPRNITLSESLNLINGGRFEAALPEIGFAGELRDKKGLRPLLAGNVQINKRKPSALLIIGDVRAGDDRQLFDEFRHLYPELQITITGFVPHRDPPEYYSLVDVFVQPSPSDGLKNALLEAIACGKAVLGTRVGGIMDVLTDCKHGRLVSTNDLAHATEE